MKKGSVLLIVLYMLCTHVFASGCFSFDDANIGTAAVKENAIDLNRGVGQYFEHWISVNGSPSILANGAFGSANFIAASGTQGLAMSACGSNNSEGAAYGYGFQTGRSYRVIFTHRMIRADNGTTPAIDSFNLILANGLVHNNQGGCGATVAVPSGSQYVYHNPNYHDTNWKTDTIYIHNLTTSYTYLWFRINIAQGISDASTLVIDDLCVEDVTTISKCFNFDDLNIGAAAVKENAIDLNRGVGQYFEHWISVNGSPSILSNGALGSANFIAASGTQGLLMAACGADNSEGAAYGYGFQQGRSYSVIFKHRMIRVDNSTTPAIDSFNLILANGLVHNNQGGCGATVAVPSGSQYVYNSPNYNDTTWRADTIYIHSLTTSYTYLWFRINIAQGMSDASFLVLDDLCVSDVTNTGINEVDRSADLTIYPDPATDHITITTGTALHDYMLQVVNISGQVLYPVVERSEKGLLRIDVSSLQSGTYILHLRSAEGTMTKRFVVLK